MNSRPQADIARILLIVVILSLLASRSIIAGVPRTAPPRDIASASGNVLDVNVPGDVAVL